MQKMQLKSSSLRTGCASVVFCAEAVPQGDFRLLLPTPKAASRAFGLGVLGAHPSLRRANRNVIFAGSGPAISAAKAATTSIPIIFITGFDPVVAGFVGSLNRPSGNVTDVFCNEPSSYRKQLGQYLHVLGARRGAVVYWITAPN
jgi:hypothetical protein